jgi:uncharacterized protein (DUF58 family)
LRGRRLLFASYPGTKDVALHNFYKGGLSKWTWRFYTHRLTRAGRWVGTVTFILGLMIVPSLDIQVYIPLMYILGLWLLTGICVVFARPRVTVRGRQAERIRAGETLPVEVTVTYDPTTGRRGRLGFPPIELNLLPERLPLDIDAVPSDGVPVGTLLKPGESRTVRLGLSCPIRGVYKLWGYRVESDFPFGFINAYRVFHEPHSLTVHPAFTELQRMDLPVGRRYQPGGVMLASKLGDSLEYLGNRQYREGDNIRDIDWRTTARHGGSPIALREYREEYFLRVGIVLDTFLPQRGKRNERAARRNALEDAVSLCAAISDYIARQDYLVDLFAAGPDIYHLTAGRSLAFLDQILDILSCVEGSPTEPIDVVAPQMETYLSRLTTVVCIFLSYDETRQRFVENLRISGAGVKVIVVEPEHFPRSWWEGGDDRTPRNDGFAVLAGDVMRLTHEEIQSGVSVL